MAQQSTSDKSGPQLLGESAKEVEMLLRKSGRFTPERQRELDELSRKQSDRDRRLMADMLIRDSGVFEKYKTARMDDIELPASKLSADEMKIYASVLNELRSLLALPSTIILRGGNGPGKTHLASALVNEFCFNGRSAFYCRALDFFTMVKSTFGAPGKTVEELERKFRRYELLALDEIEVRSGSAWEDNVLRGLIDARYGNMKATVIITNKRPEELSTYFSAAILSRISEGGAILNCDWKSLRGAK